MTAVFLNDCCKLLLVIKKKIYFMFEILSCHDMKTDTIQRTKNVSIHYRTLLLACMLVYATNSMTIFRFIRL